VGSILPLRGFSDPEALPLSPLQPRGETIRRVERTLFLTSLWSFAAAIPPPPRNPTPCLDPDVSNRTTRIFISCWFSRLVDDQSFTLFSATMLLSHFPSNALPGNLSLSASVLFARFLSNVGGSSTGHTKLPVLLLPPPTSSCPLFFSPSTLQICSSCSTDWFRFECARFS